MRCPWYLFHRFFEFGQGHRGPMIPYCPGAPRVVSPPLLPPHLEPSVYDA
ncbi:unnamed protein product [Staurois parvus]|uniref:Uncharacterized protein n=1 Tax=Staurois parvus TaxID=386267 RepID=A0ABN9GCW8_9NEOB|nr:unnamed protein product [Staurois parvus]